MQKPSPTYYYYHYYYYLIIIIIVCNSINLNINSNSDSVQHLTKQKPLKDFERAFLSKKNCKIFLKSTIIENVKLELTL